MQCILTRRTSSDNFYRPHSRRSTSDDGSRSSRKPVRNPLVPLCVALRRRAFLLDEAPGDESGEEPLSRKDWIEKRLQELAGIFAVGVAGFSVMDNHLHVLVRLDPDVAKGWSDEEVVRRWGALFPPRDKSRQPLPVSEAWVEVRLKDVQWVAMTLRACTA